MLWRSRGSCLLNFSRTAAKRLPLLSRRRGRRACRQAGKYGMEAARRRRIAGPGQTAPAALRLTSLVQRTDRKEEEGARGEERGKRKEKGERKEKKRRKKGERGKKRGKTKRAGFLPMREEAGPVTC